MSSWLWSKFRRAQSIFENGHPYSGFNIALLNTLLTSVLIPVIFYILISLSGWIDDIGRLRDDPRAIITEQGNYRVCLSGQALDDGSIMFPRQDPDFSFVELGLENEFQLTLQVATEPFSPSSLCHKLRFRTEGPTRIHRNMTAVITQRDLDRFKLLGFDQTNLMAADLLDFSYHTSDQIHWTLRVADDRAWFEPNHLRISIRASGKEQDGVRVAYDDFLYLDFVIDLKPPIQVQYDSEQLTLFFEQALGVNDVLLIANDKQRLLTDDFEIIAMMSGAVPSRICFQYKVQNSPIEIPQILDCEQVFDLELPQDQIFWNASSDQVIKLQSRFYDRRLAHNR